MPIAQLFTRPVLDGNDFRPSLSTMLRANCRYVKIKGFEVIQALGRSSGAIFNLTEDIRGQVPYRIEILQQSHKMDNDTLMVAMIKN